MYAGDLERERAAATLKEHYVGGRLTFDELSERTELVLRARSRADLRRALAGLPWFSEAAVARGRGIVRGAMLVLFTGAYLMFSFALLAVFGLTALVRGVSTSGALAFLLVWLVPTVLLSRLWRARR